MGVRPSLRRWSLWVGWLVALAAITVNARVDASHQATAQTIVAGTVVDEAGKPVAGVRVSAEASEPVVPATTGADGAFRLSLPTNFALRVFATLMARSVDGRVGINMLSFEAAKPEAATIILKPTRPLAVRVVDGAGQPVAGAEVHALANFQQVASGRTGDGGMWLSQVPEDIKMAWRVYALKPSVGFDYAQAERARGSTEPRLPLPERLTLTLDGARPPLRIKTLDRNGKPLAGIEVGPWLIQKPGHESQMNGMQNAFRKTDAAGVATIDWLPARHQGQISIISRPSKAHYSPDHAAWLDADRPVNEVTLTFLPLEGLSGRVSTGDGRPAACATVCAQGQGSGQNAYRGVTHTDADGRFKFAAYSEQAYILTASKNDLAAPYRSGVVVRAGKPVEGVDLVLGPGTRLRGRVTVGKKSTPVANVSVSAVVDKGSIPAELKREGDRFYRPMAMWTWSQTDSHGRYEFLLGPGEYRVQGPARVEPVKLTIPATSPPRELVRDFAMPRAERGPFAVTVVDESGKAVANAVVEGAYQAMTAYFTQVVTNPQGTVHLDRSLDPLVLVARTSDRSRAGVAHVDAEATDAKVIVKPTATATGRLTDPQGKPITGQTLNYGVRIQEGPNRNGPFSWHFGGTAITDGTGQFHLQGLLVGETYEIYVHDEASGRFPTAEAKVLPADPGVMALGDVPIDLRPPKPYVPPTPAERTNEAFAARKEKTPRGKLEYTLVEAKREYTRPLVLFGNPKDPVCVELFRLFNERSQDDSAKGQPPTKSPADLRWEFELASLDTSRGNVQALAKDLGLAAAAGDPPYLAVLTNEGRPVESHPLRFGPDKTLDAHSLADFLLKHKLPTRDAEAMLSNGLLQAKVGDRRVFLIASASWCGPCRMLARFLAANKAELEPHYVFVKLDVSRDTHAKELLERYEGKNASNGVPWYVILDAAGKPLITSNSKEVDEQYGSSNVGFPSSKAGIGHFMTMLRQTAPRLSGQALASLRQKLERNP